MTLVRYRYLKEEGIVNDPVALSRAITSLGFPAPIALGVRTRAWDLDEVMAWVKSRPRVIPKVSTPASRKRPPAVVEEGDDAPSEPDD